MYPCDSLHTEENDVFTNAGPSSSMPPTGYPQGIFALEQIIDELAEKLRIDPLALRDRMDQNSVRRVERQIMRESAVWKSHNPIPDSGHGPVRRGIGMAQATWPRTIEISSAAEVRIDKDGSVEVFSAVQDTGGGIKTVLAQIVAEEFGIMPSEVGVRTGDSNYPVGPASGLSVCTVSLAPAVRDAAWQAKNKFLANIAAACGTTTVDLEWMQGEVRRRSGRVQPLSFRQAAARMSVSEVSVRADRVPDYASTKAESYGGVTAAEVEVDMEIGRIHVRRVLAVLDCGRAINPAQIVSQVHGGIMRGISQSLFEQRLLDSNTGYMVNANLEQYKIAGSHETPEIELKLVQAYAGQSSTDASGVGAGAGLMAIGAAIANAFYNATGKRIRRTPMVPSQVLAVCGEAATESAMA
jgi:xanthine dehydrogenase YagR molybdenum-binding subunit